MASELRHYLPSNPVWAVFFAGLSLAIALIPKSISPIIILAVLGSVVTIAGIIYAIQLVRAKRRSSANGCKE
jgi:uncharacterized membrane protein HdeD (DUF308 family)